MENIIYAPTFYGVLCILFFAVLFQIAAILGRGTFFDWMREKRKKIGAAFFFISALSIFLFYALLVYLQYIAWKEAGPPLSFFVPPHQSISYVFEYYFSRFLIYYALSLAAGAALLVFMLRLNKSGEERFLEPEEPYLAALAVALLGDASGHYIWVFYLVSVFILGALISVFRQKILKKEARTSFYWLWIPLAIVGILIVEFVIIPL